MKAYRIYCNKNLQEYDVNVFESACLVVERLFEHKGITNQTIFNFLIKYEEAFGGNKHYQKLKELNAWSSGGILFQRLDFCLAID